MEDTSSLPTPRHVHRSPLATASLSLLKPLALLLVHVLWAWWVMRLEPAAGSGSGALVHHGGLLWAPAGLALAALLCWGTRQLTALWLGNLALALMLDTPPLLALALACSQVFGPWVAVHWLKSVGFQASLQRGRDMVQLIILGGLVGSGLSALGACLALQAAGLMPAHAALAHLLLSWASQALGALGLTALLMRIARFKLADLAAAPSTWPAQLLGVTLAAACVTCTACLLREPQLGVASLSWLLLTLGLFSVLALRGQGSLAVGTLPLLLGGPEPGHRSGSRASGHAEQHRAERRVSALRLHPEPACLACCLPSAPRYTKNDGIGRDCWRPPASAWPNGASATANAASARWSSAAKPAPTWARYTGTQLERDAWPSDWLAVAHPLDRERCRQAIESLLPPGGPDEFLEPLRLNTAGRPMALVRTQGQRSAARCPRTQLAIADPAQRCQLATPGRRTPTHERGLVPASARGPGGHRHRLPRARCQPQLLPHAGLAA